MSKMLVLLRGLPGSGKSYLGHYIWTSVFEADKYFEQDGEYKFDPSKLKEAHQWCKDQVKGAMELNLNSEGHYYPEIVVCNTFSQEWEMQPYFDLASAYGYKVVSLIVENRHGSKNVHNVPEETLEKMRKRFEVKL